MPSVTVSEEVKRMLKCMADGAGVSQGRVVGCLLGADILDAPAWPHGGAGFEDIAGILRARGYEASLAVRGGVAAAVLFTAPGGGDLTGWVAPHAAGSDEVQVGMLAEKGADRAHFAYMGSGSLHGLDDALRGVWDGIVESSMPDGTSLETRFEGSACSSAVADVLARDGYWCVPVSPGGLV